MLANLIEGYDKKKKTTTWVSYYTPFPIIEVMIEFIILRNGSGMVKKPVRSPSPTAYASHTIPHSITMLISFLSSL